MGLKIHKRVTAGQRNMISQTFEDLTKKPPERKLTKGHVRRAGRSRQGSITVRRKGGGAKRCYRIVDFTMKKEAVKGIVSSIEYDPNRTCRIALINYADGDKRYVVAPAGLKVGDDISIGENAPLTTGNALPLSNIPIGTLIYNLQLSKDKDAQIVRAAGAYAQILAKEGGFANIKLPSGEIRKFRIDCKACIGQVGNIEHSSLRIGKAGRSRHMGRRPRVKGVSMNPIDHPLGGGEGRSSGGRHPSSPWGKLEKKTRKKKLSDKYIVKRRK